MRGIRALRSMHQQPPKTSQNLPTAMRVNGVRACVLSVHDTYLTRGHSIFLMLVILCRPLCVKRIISTTSLFTCNPFVHLSGCSSSQRAKNTTTEQEKPNDSQSTATKAPANSQRWDHILDF